MVCVQKRGGRNGQNWSRRCPVWGEEHVCVCLCSMQVCGEGNGGEMVGLVVRVGNEEEGSKIGWN
jgi:hypothetical protein